MSINAFVGAGRGLGSRRVSLSAQRIHITDLAQALHEAQTPICSFNLCLLNIQDAGPQEHIDILATGMVALFGGLGPFCFGFDVGVSPGALRALMMSPTMSLG